MLHERRPGRRATGDAMLWLLAAGNFIVGIGAFMVIGLMTPISTELRLSPLAAGWIVSAYALAYAVASPLLTAATGRTERWLLLAVALGLFGLGMVVAAAAASAGALYSGRVVSALGAALFTPGAAAVAVTAAGPQSRGRALSIIFTGFTMAQVAGVPAGAWLGYVLGWRGVFLGVGALALAVAVLVAAALPRGIAVPPTTLGAFGRVLRSPALAVSAMYLCTTMAAAWVPYTFLGPLIEQKLDGGGATVSALLAVYGLGALIGNIAGGRVTDRLGPTRTLLIVASLNILLLALVTTLPWTWATGAMLLLAWSANGWAVMVPQQARLVGLAPAEAQILLALNASGIYIGGALGSAVGAATLSAGGLWWTGPVGALVGALALAHLLLAIRLSGR